MVSPHCQEAAFSWLHIEFCTGLSFGSALYNYQPISSNKCLKVLIGFKLSHYWASYLLAWPECEVATDQAASELALILLLNLRQQDHLLHVLAKNIGSFQHSHLSSAYPHVCGSE